ncbi:MAG: hypothetical protein GX852_02885 [Clostridiales bacterium]|jgi:hypothetical protein|nr:hypothetical protein [Clostridiales bacterium]
MLEFNSRTIYIKERKPTEIESLRISSDIDSSEAIIEWNSNKAEIETVRESEIYAILFCDVLSNITIITDDDLPSYITLVFTDSSDYDASLGHLKYNLSKIKFSAQNIKLTSYAKSIAAKLKDKIKVMIIDAQTENGIVECPSCGVVNDIDPSMPYCLECGSSL